MATDEASDERQTDEEWDFLHEELIPTLVVVGVLLVLFPDPATTTLGLVLLGIGVLLWARDIVQ